MSQDAYDAARVLQKVSSTFVLEKQSDVWLPQSFEANYPIMYNKDAQPFSEYDL